MAEQDSELDLTQLRSAIMPLVQLATARRMRERDPEGATGRFLACIRQVLLIELPIVLRFQGDGIFSDETKLSGEDLLAQHLCRVLHSEGLRALFIEPAVCDEELRLLSDLLTRDWESRAVFEADLPTKAWQASFMHIHLDVAAQALSSETQNNDEVLIDTLRRQLSTSGQLGDGNIGAMLQQLRDVTTRAEAWDPYHEESQAMLSNLREAEALHQELEQIRKNADTSLTDIGSVLLETLRLARSIENVHQICQRLVDHVLHACAEGQPGEVALLHGPLSLLDTSLFPKWPFRTQLQESLRGLAGVTLWDAVLEGWSRCPDESVWLGPLFTISSVTSPDVARQVAFFASRLPHRALRQAVADGLALVQIRAGRSPSILLQRTDPASWTVSLLAMSRSSDATVLASVLSSFSSDDPKIREAVLVAVRRHQSPRIKAVVRAGLSDQSEVVRLEALRYIAVYRDTDGGSQIAKMLGKLPPGSRSEQELSAMARALVVIQGKAAIDTLKSIAMQPELEELNPALVDAILGGLFTAGRNGSAALDAIGLARPPLRPRIRNLLGS